MWLSIWLSPWEHWICLCQVPILQQKYSDSPCKLCLFASWVPSLQNPCGKVEYDSVKSLFSNKSAQLCPAISVFLSTKAPKCGFPCGFPHGSIGYVSAPAKILFSDKSAQLCPASCLFGNRASSIPYVGIGNISAKSLFSDKNL